MTILVINCGSSSAKYQLFDITSHECLGRGVVERIGCSSSNIRGYHKLRQIHRKVECRNHHAAMSIIVDALTDPVSGVIGSKSQIEGIGHRVVHGGEEFRKATLITARVMRSIERCNDLAPLHNPPALAGIKACSKIFKGVQQVAVFDTSFHQTMEPKAFLYGLPLKYYGKLGIRKYGFHGTSHQFVAGQAAKALNRPLEKLKLVTCHLGNGCSMAAVKYGRSIDTTMGFTPLEGLLMGTRCGDLDPAVVFYIMAKEGLSPDRISDILNKESGLLGVSGVSNDMRDVIKASRSGGPRGRRAKAALDIFIYRIEKYIGAYQAAMDGLDAVVFTAGIGENNPWIVKRIERDMKNMLSGSVKLLVIPTNEELLIARETHNTIIRSR